MGLSVWWTQWADIFQVLAQTVGLVEVCSGIKGGGIWGGYYVGICSVGCALGRGLWLRVTLKVG